MIEDIRRQLDAYHAWLRDKSVLRQINQWVEITTPYLDRHNDYLQIYAKPVNGGYLLTDDGYTIDDLEQSGCGLETGKRQELLQMTVNGFGVQVQDKILQVKASADNFAIRKHNLIQTMLAVNDMFYLAEPRIASLFLEDVASWLDGCEIRYISRAKFNQGRPRSASFTRSIVPVASLHRRWLFRGMTRGQDGLPQLAPTRS